MLLDFVRDPVNATLVAVMGFRMTIPSECQTVWMFDLIWVQTVSKGYQQTAEV